MNTPPSLQDHIAAMLQDRMTESPALPIVLIALTLTIAGYVYESGADLRVARFGIRTANAVRRLLVGIAPPRYRRLSLFLWI